MLTFAHNLLSAQIISSSSANNSYLTFWRSDGCIVVREFIASLICHATRRSSSTLAGAELSSFRRCCFETQHTTHSLALFATASLQHSVLFINIARLDQQHSSLSTKLLIIHNSHRSQQGVCEYHCNKVSSALPLLAAFRLRCLLHFTALLLHVIAAYCFFAAHSLIFVICYCLSLFWLHRCFVNNHIRCCFVHNKLHFSTLGL